MASSKKLKSFGAMAETKDLPEEIILDILSRLPVKSLIRFTCVSKRLHFIILSDPKFAQSQLQTSRQSKTLNPRLLVATEAFRPSRLGNPSSVRKFNLLGSCNGLVFVAVHDKLFYIYNPSTGLMKQLPDIISYQTRRPNYYGVGYLTATDDYKVLVASAHFQERQSAVLIFSLRTHIWKRSIESHIPRRLPSNYNLQLQGTLFNEVLHWPLYDSCFFNNEIVCFDLVNEVFRRMRLPDNFGHERDDIKFSNSSKIRIVVCGGCLCVSNRKINSVDFWVMREYDSRDSWTKLYSLRLKDLPEWPSCLRELFLGVECSSEVAMNWTAKEYKLMRTDHKRRNYEIFQYHSKVLQGGMVEYEETLLWISGYLPKEEKQQQVQILETHQEASQS